MDASTKTESKSQLSVILDAFYINQQQTGKRADIQGLRAIAILLVLGTHFFPAYFPNGYLGVDVFFVISGYVMSLVLSKDKEMDISNTTQFYIRRIKRIFPVYYLTATLVLVITIYFMSYAWLTTFLDKMVPCLLLYRNTISIGTSLAPTVQPGTDLSQKAQLAATDRFTRIFNHSWSLCVELQFYLIVPIIFYFIKNVSKSRRIPVSTVMVFLAASSFSYFYWRFAIINKPTQDTIAKVWEFCFGILAFYYSKPRGASALPPTTTKRCAMAGAHILLYLCLLCGFYRFEFSNIWFRVHIVTITALVLITGSYSNTVLLCNWPLRYIGDASYVIYMVHWPALRISDYFSHEYGWSNGSTLLISFVASCAFVLLIHHGFENPLLKWSVASNMILIVLLMVVSIGLTVFGKSIGQLRLGPNSDEILKNMNLDRESPYDMQSLAKLRNGSGVFKVVFLGNGMAMQQFFAMESVLRNTSATVEIHTADTHPLVDIDDFKELVKELRPSVLVLAAPPLKEMLHKFYGPRKDVLYKTFLKSTRFYARFTKKIIIVGPMPDFPIGVLSELIDRVQHHNNKRLPGDLHMPFAKYQRKSWPFSLRIRALTRTCKKCMFVEPAHAFKDTTNKKILMFNPKTRISYITNRNSLTTEGVKQLNHFYMKRLRHVMLIYSDKSHGTEKNQIKHLTENSTRLLRVLTKPKVVPLAFNDTDQTPFEGSGDG